MSNEERPFIGSCSFCGDGLIRFYRCTTCDEVVALCDECELMWVDIESLAEDQNLSSDTSFPQSPSCGQADATFENATTQELEDLKLDKFSAGESV